MKKCSICLVSKDISQFYKNCRSRDGYQSHCKKCHSGIMEKWLEGNRDAKRKYSRESMARWRKSNPKKVVFLREKYWGLYGGKYKANARYKAKLKREKILIHYGSKCACCGQPDFRFLCLDHKNNDGYKHRRNKRINMHDFIIKNNFPDSFQILCFNCNFARAFYGGPGKVCPHKMEARNVAD